MTETTSNEVIKTEKFTLPAKSEYYKFGRVHSYGAAHDSRVIISKQESDLVEGNWTAKKKTYKDGSVRVEYKHPDERFPEYYYVEFDSKAKRFAFNHRYAGNSGVALTLNDDESVDFGPYAPRKIEGAGLYWDAHSFKNDFELFLRLVDDSGLNTVLPKESLPNLSAAFKQGIKGWETEIEKVGPTGDLHLKMGQEDWKAYERISHDYAGLPKT